VLESSVHYQLWDSVDRFLMQTVALLKAGPLQIPRAQRLLPRLLALLGRLPLSDHHANVPVSLDDVAALVTTCAQGPAPLPALGSHHPNPDPPAGAGGAQWLLLLQPLVELAFGARAADRVASSRGLGVGGIHAPLAPLNCVLFEELLACVGAEEEVPGEREGASGEGREGVGEEGGEVGGRLGGAGVVVLLGERWLMHEAAALDLLRLIVLGLMGGGVEGLQPAQHEAWAPPAGGGRGPGEGSAGGGGGEVAGQGSEAAAAMTRMVRDAALPVLLRDVRAPPGADEVSRARQRGGGVPRATRPAGGAGRP